MNGRPPTGKQRLGEIGPGQVRDAGAETAGEHDDRAGHPAMTVVVPW